MRRYKFYGVALGMLLLVLAVGSYAVAGSSGSNNFIGDPMIGYNENPDVSTVAHGQFVATLSPDRRMLSYRLSYNGLEGAVQQAHIHFGKAAVNGGISIFLCANGDFRAGQRATLPTCPQSGTVTDTVDMTAVVGPAGQGIAAGELGEVIAAMEAGRTYANVHSVKFPGGEIRAQLVGSQFGGGRFGG